MLMKMTSTFREWNSYHVTVLFPWWDVKTHWGYICTWIIVCMIAMMYQAIKAIVYGVEVKMAAPSCYRRQLTWVNAICQYLPDNNLLFLRIVHAITHAVSYFISIILMLISMTFNPGIFVALIIGYWVGDLSFEVLHDDID